MPRERQRSTMYMMAMLSPVDEVKSTFSLQLEEDSDPEAEALRRSLQSAGSGQGVEPLRRLLSREGARPARRERSLVSAEQSSRKGSSSEYSSALGDEEGGAAWSNSSESASLTPSSIPNTPVPLPAPPASDGPPLLHSPRHPAGGPAAESAQPTQHLPHNPPPVPPPPLPAAAAAAAAATPLPTSQPRPRSLWLANPQVARSVAGFLPLGSFAACLGLCHTARAVWNAQAVWHSQYLNRGGCDAPDIRDYRGRCKLLLPSRPAPPRPQPQGCGGGVGVGVGAGGLPPQQQAAQQAAEAATDELLAGLDAIDSNVRGLEEWAKAHKHSSVRRRVKGVQGVQAGGGVDHGARDELYRKELKRSCEATPLQRLCQHESLEVSSTLDPACHDVRCTRCQVAAMLKIRRGAAVVAGVSLGMLNARKGSGAGGFCGTATLPARPALGGGGGGGERCGLLSKPLTASSLDSAPVSHPLPPLAQRNMYSTR